MSYIAFNSTMSAICVTAITDSVVGAPYAGKHTSRQPAFG
jgi:hypothetical protein